MLPVPDWFKHAVTFAGVRGPVSLFSHLLANPRRLKVESTRDLHPDEQLAVFRLQNLTFGRRNQACRRSKSTFRPCSLMAATMSRATANARRPSSKVTIGGECRCTDSRNDFSSACRGSSSVVGGFVIWICGFTEGVPEGSS